MALRRNQHNYAKARRLRRKMSLPEVLLWQQLKGGPMGFSFRKQHAVDEYVIDFYCAAVKTGFEVDGMAHDMGERPELDEERTAFIAEQGIQLMRIPANDVLADPTAVAQSIVDLCRGRR